MSIADLGRGEGAGGFPGTVQRVEFGAGAVGTRVPDQEAALSAPRLQDGLGLIAILTVLVSATPHCRLM